METKPCGISELLNLRRSWKYLTNHLLVEFILNKYKTFYSGLSKNLDMISWYFVHFLEFIKWRTQIFTIDVSYFFFYFTEIDTDKFKVLVDENPKTI